MLTITFTEQEMQSLAALVDAAVRATGLQSVKQATAILEKLESAQPAETEEAEAEPQDAG